MKSFFSIALGLLITMSSFAENKEQRVLVGDWNTIEVSKGANVSLVQGDKSEIEVVTDGCPTKDVITTVKNGVLQVQMKKRTAGSAVQVFVYFSDLESIKVKRGASIETDCLFKHQGKLTLEVGAQCEAKMDIDVDELVVDASTCIITLEGRADRQSVDIAGTVGDATYDAEELNSKSVKIKAMRTDCKVKFSDSLEAEAIGCSIRFVGDESKVKKTEKVGGSIDKL